VAAADSEQLVCCGAQIVHTQLSFKTNSMVFASKAVPLPSFSTAQGPNAAYKIT
jgi:hypothetical protein